jgi:mono/diheme cytochrome c family protein
LPDDSNGYKMSSGVKDPLPLLNAADLSEAQRLYNINCAICHGVNLDAQGPMATSGKVGGIANLQLDQYKALPIGTMFHVTTYGKGNMGSYASQLSKKQRWMVVQYVKSQQAKQSASTTDSTKVAGKDSTASTAKK